MTYASQYLQKTLQAEDLYYVASRDKPCVGGGAGVWTFPCPARRGGGSSGFRCCKRLHVWRAGKDGLMGPKVHPHPLDLEDEADVVLQIDGAGFRWPDGSERTYHKSVTRGRQAPMGQSTPSGTYLTEPLLATGGVVPPGASRDRATHGESPNPSSLRRGRLPGRGQCEGGLCQSHWAGRSSS